MCLHPNTTSRDSASGCFADVASKTSHPEMAARGPRAGSRNPETGLGPRCQGARRGRPIENVEFGRPTSANLQRSARISGEEDRLGPPWPLNDRDLRGTGAAAWCLSEARERLCRQHLGAWCCCWCCCWCGPRGGTTSLGQGALRSDEFHGRVTAHRLVRCPDRDMTRSMAPPGYRPEIETVCAG